MLNRLTSYSRLSVIEMLPLTEQTGSPCFMRVFSTRKEILHSFVNSWGHLSRPTPSLESVHASRPVSCNFLNDICKYKELGRLGVLAAYFQMIVIVKYCTMLDITRTRHQLA